MPHGVPKAPGPPCSAVFCWGANAGLPAATGPPFAAPMEPQLSSPPSLGGPVEFGGLEVIVALVVFVVVFIKIVLFGPFDSVLRLVGGRPPLPLLLLPNTLPFAVPLVASSSSVVPLLFGAAMPPQPSAAPCCRARPSLEQP